MARNHRLRMDLAACLVALSCFSCRTGDTGQPSPSGSSAPGSGASALRTRPEFVHAPDGPDVPAIVAREVSRAKADHRELLVYVGAPWCEPCTRFHQAIERGELDATFSSLRLLEFDSDRDGERLQAAGYVSRLIPLFVAPAADGTPTTDHIEGSVKGDEGVTAIVPRLTQLVARTRGR